MGWRLGRNVRYARGLRKNRGELFWGLGVGLGEQRNGVNTGGQAARGTRARRCFGSIKGAEGLEGALS